MIIVVFILMLISLCIFASYLITMIHKYGIPASISDTYYLLKDNHREWLFTFAMWGTAFPLMPAFIISSTVDYTAILAFLSCAALCFVGAAPEFKRGLDRVVHISATVICALCSQAWVMIYDPYLLLLWSVPLVILTVKAIQNVRKNRRDEKLTQYPTYWSRPLLFRANPLFWIEVTAFTTAYLALLI